MRTDAKEDLRLRGQYIARIIASAAAFMLFGAAVGPASARLISKSNILTAKHVMVKGTHVAVVPPQGAVPSSSFIGFELPSLQITYKIVERINVPFNESAGTLTAEGLEADGIELMEGSPVTLNGKRAALISGRAVPKETDGSSNASEEGGEEIGVLLLVLGDERLTVFMYGYYPMSDKSAAGLLRNSMLSTILMQGQSVSSEGYSISAEGTAFALADEASSTRYYTLGGAPLQGEIKGAIYTAKRSSQDVPNEQQAAFAENAMAMYLSAYEFSISSRKEVSFGGLKGFEITADFDGAPRKIRTASGGNVKRKTMGKGYLVVLFGEGTLYTFSGMAVKNLESYLQQFRKITSTFKVLVKR
jgi:hypothetical protein